LYLLDNDGRSVLAENDDQMVQNRIDSWISYTFARTGTYYVKIRSWDHTTSGGPGYPYTLTVIKDFQDPQAIFLLPANGSLVPNGIIPLKVGAQDAESGVSHVQFLWHSPDWQNSDWIILGEDWNGEDGWGYTFDTSSLPDLHGIAFYAKVYDWAANWLGTGSWILSPHLYLPATFR
jgi:hypothetical protein